VGIVTLSIFLLGIYDGLVALRNLNSVIFSTLNYDICKIRPFF
jgi:hypothetical protein